MFSSVRKPLLISTLAFVFAASGLLVGQSQDPSKDQSSPPPTPPTSPQSEASQPVHVSVDDVSPGLLLKKVAPKYPKEARKQHIEGVVVMKATIDTNGNIVGLTLVSGDPLLAKAAMDAVKQWKYRPYFLKGEPVEVETDIRVNFELSR
ncbi:MAG TPA: energy transducer TonB [Candidatus Sulfotelmatobacter sp.]|jgi:protein TonB|nr:energy transducer TonB [Candidatus Sulfotelmatobacter sp.]